MSEITYHIGRRIRQERRARDWTQAELGRRLGGVLDKPWTKIAVSIAERGGRRFTADELAALSEVLQHPINWFFPSTPVQLHRPYWSEISA